MQTLLYHIIIYYVLVIANSEVTFLRFFISKNLSKVYKNSIFIMKYTFSVICNAPFTAFYFEFHIIIIT